MATSPTTKPQLSSNNLVIVMLLITLLVLGISALATKALISSISLDSKVIKAKQKADDTLKKDVEAAPKLVNAYADLGPTAGTIEDALPNTADFPSLIVTLENMANISGAKLKSVTPAVSTAGSSSASASSSASTSTGTSSTSGSSSTAATASASGDVLNPTPQAYNFSISLDSSYSQLLAYLGALEKSARPMRVTSVNLTGSGSSLSAQIDLETYYQDKAQLPYGKETIK